MTNFNMKDSCINPLLHEIRSLSDGTNYIYIHLVEDFQKRLN